MLQQKKQAELLEYRNSRKNSDNDFMATITFNLLENLSKRNNFIHKQIAHYKELDKQFDQDFGISAGFYICSLITCWETFFRDLFIFICDFDPSINQILRKEIDGESLGKLTVGEYFAAKYNFQNLEQMRKALDKIYRRQTASISDYFPTEIFQNVAMTRPSIIFFWISERRLQEKIEDVLATAFNIRHRLTHDANFK
ncbi:hypothetical protein GCM10022246_24870 [Pedobacter ginsengiterrae]|uniref:RiboL-PSP-HEPN domain-containing protein n=1 Tax=Pedobacter ginsengiterrae TaxID=871696 RepID=A0ABP7PV38_9SPHI